MNNEIGAAITLAANALRVLTHLGVNLKSLGAGDYLGLHVPPLLSAFSTSEPPFRMWFPSTGGEGKFDALHDPHNTFGRVSDSTCGRNPTYVAGFSTGLCAIAPICTMS
jgi:hypothetical protein